MNSFSMVVFVRDVFSSLLNVAALIMGRVLVSRASAIMMLL